MNRCIAINKNNKKCRAKTNNLFCCEGHNPINKEIIDKGCFMCMEKISKTNEIILFKCKHAFHKICYMEWLRYSTYDTPICIICRSEVLNSNKGNKPKNKTSTIIDFNNQIIHEILNNNNPYYYNNFFYLDGFCI
jgi:hypothetical protein